MTEASDRKKSFHDVAKEAIKPTKLYERLDEGQRDGVVNEIAFLIDQIGKVNKYKWQRVSPKRVVDMLFEIAEEEDVESDEDRPYLASLMDELHDYGVPIPTIKSGLNTSLTNSLIMLQIGRHTLKGMKEYMRERHKYSAIRQVGAQYHSYPHRGE